MTGGSNVGQGFATAMAQICADTLGVDYRRVRVVYGQTDRIAYGIGAHASRASVMGIAFIMLVLVARVGLRSALSQNVLGLGLSPLVLADALLVLAVVMLTVQRLEIWLRASRMLAEARAGGAAADPPSIVK